MVLVAVALGVLEGVLNRFLLFMEPVEDVVEPAGVALGVFLALAPAVAVEGALLVLPVLLRPRLGPPRAAAGRLGRHTRQCGTAAAGWLGASIGGAERAAPRTCGWT